MRRQVNIAALLSGCGPRAPKQIELPVASPLRLDGLTIVDTGNGELTPGMSILMDSGKIVRITTTSATPTDPSVQSVDAAGKFVVPGYNNMRSHVLGADNTSGVMAMMLAKGVTCFRQLAGSPELLKARRDGTLPIGKDAPGLLAMPATCCYPSIPLLRKIPSPRFGSRSGTASTSSRSASSVRRRGLSFSLPLTTH